MTEFKHPGFEETSAKEWLTTNGIGGYASGTVSGANTRRYHGLLVASANPPTDRSVLVSKIEERVGGGEDKWVDLSANQFPNNTVHPRGFEHLTGFTASPVPSWEYDTGEHQLKKSILMEYGSNAVIVTYTNIGDATFDLAITPYFVDRDYHALFKVNEQYDFYHEEEAQQLRIHARYGARPLYWFFGKGKFSAQKHWIENLTYVREEYRGLDFREDARTIGEVTKTIAPGETYHLMFSADKSVAGRRVDKLVATELKRLRAISQSQEDPFLKDLLVAGDQFIVRRASTDSYTILAGYHWFTDWGRDTMIAMRGLCIATGKKEVSASIINTFLHYLDGGMLPNRFPDDTSQEVEYNTVDATLWLFVTMYEYYLAFGDLALVERNMDKLSDIIRQHLDGTRYNIHTLDEGFLYAGEEGVQLTWMDAKVDGYVVTPRHGCPVEIQALWYNALKIYLYFADKTGLSKGDEIRKRALATSKAIKTNFKRYYLNKSGYLYDVVVPEKSADDSLRPNQLYVLSLPFSLLSKADGKSVFKSVQKKLYTPLGLRTLAPDHPDFRSTYGGNTWERDTAYHQGTIWPFLLGEYYAAQRKLYGNTPKVNEEIKAGLEPLKEHFYEQVCLHGISEIFDGSEPRDGRGTAHQAWSVAAVIQTLLAG